MSYAIDFAIDLARLHFSLAFCLSGRHWRPKVSLETENSELTLATPRASRCSRQLKVIDANLSDARIAD